MKRVILIYLENQWYYMNTADTDDYGVLILSPGMLLITFQSSELLRHLKAIKQERFLSAIEDLESLDKQMSQEGKNLRAAKTWNLLGTLKHHQLAPANFKLSLSTMKDCLEYTVSLYQLLMEKDGRENLRFENLEKDILGIIFQRQFKGVRISQSAAKKRCVELENEIYSAKNILQTQYRVFEPDNVDCQLDYLERNDIKLVKSTLFTFKAWRNEDPVCKIWYEMFRNQKDLDSLLYMLSHWGGQERAYPKYIGFGTITSRITMRDPALQNLRKTNRSIIKADKSCRLLYVDYSQFEAGILATLSQDARMISLYNNDIYADLAKKVLGNPESRSDAKVIFYRYMYGDKSLKTNAVSYFMQFSALEAFRKKINTQIEKEGKIGTCEGNFRLRSIDEEETGWALSHLIQSTASLIYKRSVRRVFREVSGAELLIPMHDGTLYQVHSLFYDRVKKEIEEIYLDEFRKACPDLNCKINSSDIFN